MLYIDKANEQVIEYCVNKMQEGIFISKESRENHTAIYPMHNRYFSNGDKPWVILINHKNQMKLTYDGQEYTRSTLNLGKAANERSPRSAHLVHDGGERVQPTQPKFKVERVYIIQAGELVFFDDNIMHAWEMKNNDLTVYYYRAKTDKPVTQGTYCLDGVL